MGGIEKKCDVDPLLILESGHQVFKASFLAKCGKTRLMSADRRVIAMSNKDLDREIFVREVSSPRNKFFD